MHELRFERYLLTPHDPQRRALEGYAVAPAWEGQQALARLAASSRAGALLAFWSLRTGHPLIGGSRGSAVRRALEWASSGLDRSVGGLTLWRREQLRSQGRLELRGAVEPPAPREEAVDKRDFIEFELLDDDGDPVRSLPFAVTKGEETVLAGKLNRFGNVFLEPVDPGSYTFALTEEPVPPAPEPSEWIAIELLSEGGRPLVGEAFRLTDSAGTVHEGTTDDGGLAVVYGAAPGDCELVLLRGQDEPKPPPAS